MRGMVVAIVTIVMVCTLLVVACVEYKGCQADNREVAAEYRERC